MYVRQRQEIQEVLQRMNHGFHAPRVGSLMLPRHWRPPLSKCLPIGQRKNGDAGLRYRSSLAVKLALAKAETGAISPVM
jgi:hypothetical protein